jgi:putative hydrolase of HD superfamily
MQKAEIRGALNFLRQAEKFKDVLKISHTSAGRRESAAEHTWRLCLWAILCSDKLGNIGIQERAALESLARPLASKQRDEILSLWQEYANASSPEAVLAKGLDKLETILQHNQGFNPADFDYAFNLTYGLEQTSVHPLLAAIRSILDDDTRTRMSQQTRLASNRDD